MRIIAKNCPNCGASLNIDADSRTVVCEFCATKSKIQHDNDCELEKIPPVSLAVQIIVTLLAAFAIFGMPIVFIILSSGGTPPNPPEVDETLIISEARKAALDRKFCESDYDSDLRYSDLARNPDTYVERLVKFSGVIMQSGLTSTARGVRIAGDTTLFYIIEIDGDGNQLFWVEACERTDIPESLDKGDWVEIYAVVYGQTSYKTSDDRTITLPAAVAVKMENLDLSNLIEYNGDPFTVTADWFDGVTVVDSFEITSIEKYDEWLKINFEVTGMVYGADLLHVEVLCFDEDGSHIHNTAIWVTVVDGVRFRLNDEFFVPLETVRIEFVTD
jgi:hypothetical protein